jgi:hypothetical protein
VLVICAARVLQGVGACVQGSLRKDVHHWQWCCVRQLCHGMVGMSG